MSKKYTTNFLEDTNGSTGSANQVLVSTSTGVDWVDGSGSGIIGGPYLPLSAGSSYPLTGTLHGTSTNFSGSGDYAGSMTLGTGASTAEANLQIGHGRTGNGYSYVDLIGDATYTDYGFRIIRGNTGANTSSQIVHRGTGNFEIKTGDAANLIFQTASTTRMAISSGGNVGIGTITPTEKLSVFGSLLVTSSQGALDNDYFAKIQSGYSANPLIISSRLGVLMQAEDYGNSLSLHAGSTERVRIKHNGNVGIGTTNPGGKLDITYTGTGGSGTQGIGEGLNITSLSPNITFNDTSTSVDNYAIHLNQSVFTLGRYTSSTSQSPDLVLKSGNVGIGVSAPIDKLHVEGVIQSKKQLLPSTSGTAGWYKIGTLESFVQGGSTAVIEIVGHDGYNATNTQDYLIKLFIKTSNGNGSGPQLQKYNSWYERTGGNANNTIALKWDNSATNDYGLYMYIPAHSLRSYYTVTKGTGTWVHAGTSATDPGVNSASVLEATGLFNILDTNVGIGTNAPQTKLHIQEGYSNILIGSDDTYGQNYSAIGFGGLSNGNNRIFAGYDGSSVYDDMYYAAGTGKGHQFRVNGAGSTSMSITSGGNVGIGTTSVDEKLQVEAGNIKIEGGATSTVRGLILAHTGQTGNQTLLVQNTSNVPRGHLYTTERALRIEAGADGGTGTGETLDFWVNGSERMMIDTTGNVGIGATSPGTKLHVGSGSGATVDAGYQMVIDSGGIAGLQILSATTQSGRIVFGDSGDNDIGMIKYDHTDNSMGFRTNGSGNERMRITNSGNVGIGTTAPLDKLHVAGGDIRIDYGHLVVDHGTSSGGSGVILKGTGSNLPFVKWDDGTTQIAGIRATSSGDLRIQTNGFNDRLVINSSGNVGIGDTNPTMRLKVVDSTSGLLSAFTNSSSAGSGVQITAASGTANILQLRDYAGGEKLRVQGNGNVGIGTTAPSQKLEIALTSNVSLANQPAEPLFVSNSGQSVDGRVFISVKHDVINTASALGAGLKMTAGAVTTGTPSYFDSLIFLESAGPGSDTVHSAPKAIQFYVDNHATQAGSGANYASLGDLAMTIAESANIGIGNTAPSQKLHVGGNVRVTGAYYDSSNSPGTAGQVLSSTVTGTDWIDATTGDITGVTAGNGLTGGGTSGAVTVNVDYAGTDNIILEAQDLSGTQIEDGFKILFSDTSNDVSFGNVSDLPFGSSNLVIGTTSTTAKAGNITTISTAQASAITANTAKVSDTGTPAVLSNGSAPSLNTNISAGEMRTLIGAGTSSLIIGTTADRAMAGDTVIPSNNNQLTNGAGYTTSYTPDIWQVNTASDLDTQDTTLICDTVRIINGTTNTAGSGTNAGEIAIIDAGTYEITYSIAIKVPAGVTTRQVVATYLARNGTAIPGSLNSTYLRLPGSNQGGATSLFNTSYVAAGTEDTSIALIIGWLDGTNQSVDIYEPASIQNTISIRRIA